MFAPKQTSMTDEIQDIELPKDNVGADDEKKAVEEAQTEATESPVTETPEPTAEQAGPTAEQVEPTAEQTEPEAEVATEEPEAAVEEPETTAEEQPEAAVEEPEATVEEPEAAVEEPEAQPATEPTEEAEQPAEPVEQPADEQAVSEPEPTEPADEAAPAEEPAPEAQPVRKPATKDEIIERLRQLAETDAEAATKAEIDGLKQTFYKLHNAERDEAKAQFIEGGGKEEEFVAPTDEREETFKALMATIREKRNAANAEQEKQKEENLQIKLDIIERIRQLVESPQDPNKSYNEFRRLQQQWNEVKAVPQNRANEIWKSYRLYVEKFYDLLKLNSEFRKLDFKKNLEIKERICQTAEKLAEDPDVVSAFHQLQKLHQQFRETGPVAKELREQVWTRFKAASTAINRRHQQHFEELKKKEDENLDQKTVICEIVEAIDFDELKTFAAWEAKTKEVIALQAKWKTIGFAPQKMNVKIFERFRKACDEFFRRKAEFFKELKGGMNENLEKKRALCEKAEALKESTDWKATAAELTKLQKEWKTIGPVAKKHSDAIWKRFITACDYFYDQKNKATSSQHSAEMENLARKKAVIEKLAAIDEDTDSREGAWQVGDLIREWNSIGHVPFKEKDKLYKQYRALVDELSDRFGVSGGRRSSGYSTGRSGYGEGSSTTGSRERDRLVRTFEAMKAELQTYENNLGFLTASSKKGSTLVDGLKRKADKLRADIEEVKQKIQALDDAADNSEE